MQRDPEAAMQPAQLLALVIPAQAGIQAHITKEWYVARKTKSLGSGFRRNDGGSIILLICPRTRETTDT